MAVKIGNRLNPFPTPLSEQRRRITGVSSEIRDLETVKSVAGFLKKVRDRENYNLEKTYGSTYSAPGSVRKTAMGENSGPAGGYIVPLDYSLALMDTIEEESFIYPRANVIPMNSAETQCPKVDVETAQTVGIAPYFGGVNYTWGSSQAPTETEPTFRQLTLRAWDLLGYCTVSNDWLNDVGPEGDNYLIKLLGRGAAWYAEYAFLQGTGTSGVGVNDMPLGILNAPGTITVSRTTSSTIVTADIANMAAQLLPYSWKNAIWACHPTCLAKIAKLPSFIINGDLGGVGGESNCGFLLSKPLYITDKLPSLGNAGDLILFDPSLYAIGNRQEVLIESSTLGPAFRTNQTDFRVWLRIGGLPQVSAPITLPDASTLVSPYLILGA